MGTPPFCRYHITAAISHQLDAYYLLKASQMTLSDCLFAYFQGFNRVLSRFGTVPAPAKT